jgi:pyruvate/2-oxoglutarate dehydrogenase complex dihydrolipoamide dehydrogenase (E3) component
VKPQAPGGRPRARLDFDAIVIGAGQAGPSLAGRLSQAGMKVALIERKLVGGTCVNTGCMPTKAMVASAYAAQLARRAGEFGVVLEGPVRVDLAKVMARKDEVSRNARTSLERWIEGLANVKLFRGQARFQSPHEVRVGDDLLAAERVFINVGTRARTPELPGLDRISALTNSSLLALKELPRHLVVIGGSYVGLEFAQMFRRFGSEVSVVERGPRLISQEDPDVSEAVRKILEHEGIRVGTSAECIHFEPRGNDVWVGVRPTNGSASLARAAAPQGVLGSHVLLAVGRQPNTEDLGLESAGVEVDARGYVVVDDSLRSSASNIWALGDCNGKGAFTHTSYNDFEIVAANLLEKAQRRVSQRVKAYALYIDPPLGRAGLSETEARRSYKHVRVGQRPMTRVGRAVEKGETQGFMKVVVDEESQQLLGAAILGPGADEAIHCVLDMLVARAPYTTLRDAMHIHPTVSELIPTVLGELSPKAG